MGAPPRHVLLLINPHSARWPIDLEPGLERLRGQGMRVDVEVMDSADAMRARIATLDQPAGRSIDGLVIGGGDGTFNGVAESLVACGRLVGVLPLGTANDLARGLGVPVDPLAACAVIGAGHRRMIDVGCVNGKYFFNVASLGAGVEIARFMRERRDRNARWGVLSYPMALVSAVRQYRAFKAHIRVDDHAQSLTCYQVSVGNGRFYGGGMRVSDLAMLDDGTLDLYAMKALPSWRILLHLPQLRAGRHGLWHGVVHLRGRVITVEATESGRPMPINTDGELTVETPAEFHVVPRILPVMVPEEVGEALAPADSEAPQTGTARPSDAPPDASKETPDMAVFRSDAEVALDDVLVACKRVAGHLADAAELAGRDAPDLATLLESQAKERAALAADMERHMIDIGGLPGEPDDDSEVIQETVRRVRDVLSTDHRRMLLDDAMAEEEDLASAVSRALQEDLPGPTLETLAAAQKRVADGISRLRALHDAPQSPE